jgi:hypothetical protein
LVLTNRVRTGFQHHFDGVRRRSVLRAALAAGALGATGAVTGCDLFEREPPAPPPPDALAPVTTEARELAAVYQAAIDAHPDLAARLTPIRDAHEAHARELSAILSSPLPTGMAVAVVSGAPAARTLDDLRSREKAAHASAVTACIEAPADRAALVGSVAAARATHLEALT